MNQDNRMKEKQPSSRSTTSSRSSGVIRPTPLTRERVVAAAIALADEIGVAPLTVRKLATSLGVGPMALYHHIANKDEILDAMVDAVFAEIELPTEEADWRSGMAQRAHSARAVFARHPWAVPMMDSRNEPGPATLAHHEAVLRCLRRDLPLSMAAHAYALIDAFVYGFALQEAAVPFDDGEGAAEMAAAILASVPDDRYPHLTEMAHEHVMQPGYDFGAEFDFGLELVLDGLAAAVAQAS